MEHLFLCLLCRFPKKTNNNLKGEKMQQLKYRCCVWHIKNTMWGMQNEKWCFVSYLNPKRSTRPPAAILSVCVRNAFSVESRANIGNSYLCTPILQYSSAKVFIFSQFRFLLFFCPLFLNLPFSRFSLCTRLYLLLCLYQDVTSNLLSVLTPSPLAISEEDIHYSLSWQVPSDSRWTLMTPDRTQVYYLADGGPRDSLRGPFS